jgi:ABC-2 type transport system ATP-binding protein
VIDIPALEIKAGEVAALVGAVDSGKEFLFQLLIGSMHPTTGNVHLSGVDPYHERKAFSRQVGVLFPEGNLYKRMSVLGNLQFYCRLYRLPNTRPLEVLELVGLADQAVPMLRSSPRLSGGWRWTSALPPQRFCCWQIRSLAVTRSPSR